MRHVLCHRTAIAASYTKNNTIELELLLGDATHLKSDGISDFFAELDVHLVGDSLRHRHGGDATWLSAADHSELGIPEATNDNDWMISLRENF